ncbi:DUF2695 domain-containing protein [Agrococcus sp. ARC_14]|uniref:DUF2695 domain-containing protein n=1 Tax=Agrococcus sp. ARC_14 TaxID=2919927 RepID=UPI001F06D1F9|nr:DUF2695 domain-containing protein [Agrococcus sp. ARC_14]MCH1883860.1 DUF2695 domain-containing protein [Agrococcus sp. ARC_14]
MDEPTAAKSTAADSTAFEPTASESTAAESTASDAAGSDPAGSDPAAEPIMAEAEAEAHVRELAELWLAPHERECLGCYLDRTITAFGCQGDLRLAARFRDLIAPRAVGLERRLADAGGYCDCEVLANVFQPAAHLWTLSRDEELPNGGWVDIEPEPPAVMPPCSGVRRGSTLPCSHWSTWR